jgi:hypothetical protein
MPRQPLSVRTGHDAVLATVQVQDWGTYQPRTETPGSDVGQVVVDRPARAAFDWSPLEGGGIRHA